MQSIKLFRLIIHRMPFYIKIKTTVQRDEIKNKIEQTTSFKKDCSIFRWTTFIQYHKQNIIVSIQQKQFYSIRNRVNFHKSDTTRFPTKKWQGFSSYKKNKPYVLLKPFCQKVTSNLKAIIQFIKESVLSINRLLSLGSSLFLLLVTISFLGVFMH